MEVLELDPDQEIDEATLNRLRWLKKKNKTEQLI